MVKKEGNGPMIVICMDCERKIRRKPPYPDTSISHGICPRCADKRRRELRAKYPQIKLTDTPKQETETWSK